MVRLRFADDVVVTSEATNEAESVLIRFYAESKRDGLVDNKEVEMTDECIYLGNLSRTEEGINVELYGKILSG